MSFDLLNRTFLKDVFAEIRCPENLMRKRENYIALQVYKERQKDLILQCLCDEYGGDSVVNMRKFTSLNLTRRIVHSKASIYKKEPERVLSGVESDQTIELFDNIYKYSKANQKLKIANRYKVLLSQCAMQIIPKRGVLETRVLTPFHYDVIPYPDDPTRAMAYIVQMNSRPGKTLNNSFDFEIMDKNIVHDGGDWQNQIIADEDDDILDAMRFVVWSDDLNFMANGKGQIIDPMTNEVSVNISEDQLLNPIGMLPFIDVADQKDFEFWVDRGLNLVEFALDIWKMDTDIAETNRLQGYAQPIISAVEQPKRVKLGPNTALFLQKNKKDPALNAEFEFASPNPDLSSSMEIRNNFINTFLTSHGLDKSVINTTGDTTSFSSGIERHLAMVQRFEESQDDLDLFEDVEQQYFEISRAWVNQLSGVPIEEGGLIDDLQGTIPMDAQFFVKFQTPEMLQTKLEQEESLKRKMEAGRMSIVEAVMEERQVDREMAIEILEQIAEDNALYKPNGMGQLMNTFRRVNAVEQETQEDAIEPDAEAEAES